MVVLWFKAQTCSGFWLVLLFLFSHIRDFEKVEVTSPFSKHLATFLWSLEIWFQGLEKLCLISENILMNNSLKWEVREENTTFWEPALFQVLNWVPDSSHSLFNSSPQSGLLSSVWYRCENQGSNRLGNFPRAILLRGGAQMETQICCFQSPCSFHYMCCRLCTLTPPDCALASDIWSMTWISWQLEKFQLINCAFTIGRDPGAMMRIMCFQASLLMPLSEIWRTPPILNFVSEASACLQVQSACVLLNRADSSNWPNHFLRYKK